ncbi:Mitochondrial zinc maintenance protein 1, mitochondrial [Lecanicillium sp. MT-2017a]|nr:Mitochondrial zinc maintenance protein 1, mitochondrial [Lecanicillium sp. MT-2017a]
MATVAYRNLWRAARIAFQGDVATLQAAQGQIRHEFRSRQSLDPSDAKVNESIQHANEVAQFLRQNVVQGQRSSGEEDTYQLRIHKDTERGDNESIKMASAGSAGAGGGCCSK